jgi:hypothetical protein
VPRNAGLKDIQNLAQVTDADLPFEQEIQYPQPRFVGEGSKQCVSRFQFIHILLYEYDSRSSVACPVGWGGQKEDPYADSRQARDPLTPDSCPLEAPER